MIKMIINCIVKKHNCKCYIDYIGSTARYDFKFINNNGLIIYDSNQKLSCFPYYNGLICVVRSFSVSYEDPTLLEKIDKLINRGKR